MNLLNLYVILYVYTVAFFIFVAIVGHVVFGIAILVNLWRLEHETAERPCRFL